MCLSANYAHHETHCMYITLQKQVDCFNHRVVTLVADKLERQWLWEVCFGIKTNCKRQPKGQLPSSSYNHDRVKSFITSVLPTLVYKFLTTTLKCICNDSFTDVLRVVSVIVVRWTGQLPIGLPYGTAGGSPNFLLLAVWKSGDSLLHNHAVYVFTPKKLLQYFTTLIYLTTQLCFIHNTTHLTTAFSKTTASRQ